MQHQIPCSNISMQVNVTLPLSHARTNALYFQFLAIWTEYHSRREGLACVTTATALQRGEQEEEEDARGGGDDEER